MTAILTLDHLRHQWVHGDQHIPGLIEGIAASAPAVFEKYGITSPLVVAMMMGQFSEECGAGLEMVESGQYSAQRLLQVFPTHFTPAMAQRAAHNPRLVFDISYGGRMGNRPPPSDDGYNFRGRGLSQVTGRGRVVLRPPAPPILEGYAGLAAKTGLPLTEHPELLSDPDHALECGVADFVLCGCLPFAERGDILNVTKHLNGGYNGLADRRMWTARWKHELLDVSAPVPEGHHVAADLQRALNALGADPQLVVDNDYGDLTRHAVMAFQSANGLDPDGNAGPETLAAINAKIKQGQSND